MSKDEIFAKVKAIIVDQLGCEEDEVTLETQIIEDLGADSLDLVELLMAAEEEFEIEASDADAMKLTKVGDAVDFIAEQIA